MHFSNPVQILLLYSMLAFVSYIESHEFRDEAPFLHVLPVITLAALTLPLTMEKKPKLCTAASFLALGMLCNRRPLAFYITVLIST